MSLDALLNKPVGEKWSTDRTKFFVCRGVTIESLEFRVQPQIGSPPVAGGRSGRSVWHEKRIQIRVFLNNNSGKDKRINIRFEGVDGEKVFCVASIQALLNRETTINSVPSLLMSRRNDGPSNRVQSFVSR